MQQPQTILREELKNRQNKNSSYSLRAFSRDLGVNPASLSQFLNGRRALSSKNLDGIAKRLGYSPIAFGAPASKAESRIERNEILREDEQVIISEWYYFAILNLAKINRCKADPYFLSRRLGIDPSIASRATDRLI